MIPFHWLGLVFFGVFFLSDSIPRDSSPPFTNQHLRENTFWTCSKLFQASWPRQANPSSRHIRVVSLVRKNYVYTPENYRKLTWNLKITCLKRKIIFQSCIFGFHAWVKTTYTHRTWTWNPQKYGAISKKILLFQGNHISKVGPYL